MQAAPAGVLHYGGDHRQCQARGKACSCSAGWLSHWSDSPVQEEEGVSFAFTIVTDKRRLLG